MTKAVGHVPAISLMIPSIPSLQQAMVTMLSYLFSQSQLCSSIGLDSILSGSSAGDHPTTIHRFMYLVVSGSLFALCMLTVILIPPEKPSEAQLESMYSMHNKTNHRSSLSFWFSCQPSSQASSHDQAANAEVLFIK